MLLNLGFIVWKRKTNSAKLSAKPPSLKNFPPMYEALDLNIIQVHYQTVLYDQCLSGKLPDIDRKTASTRYGNQSEFSRVLQG